MTLASAPLALALLSSGCVYPNRPAIYRALKSYTIDTHLAETEREPDAAAVVAGAHRVAFLAPGACRGGAAGPGQQQRTARLDLPCGVLMAEIEGGALRAGLEVVGWRRIDDAPDPVTAAREAGADLLVRVSEEEEGLVLAGRGAAGAIDYELSFLGRQEREPLELDERGALDAQCGSGFDAAIQKSIPATRLRVEAIDPSDGRVIREQQRTLTRLADDQGRLQLQQSARFLSGSLHIGYVLILPFSYGVAGTLMPALFAFDAESTWQADDAELLTILLVTGAVSLAASVAAFFLFQGMELMPKPAEELCQTPEAHWVGGIADRLGPDPERERRSRDLARELAEQVLHGLLDLDSSAVVAEGSP